MKEVEYIGGWDDDLFEEASPYKIRLKPVSKPWYQNIFN